MDRKPQGTVMHKVTNVHQLAPQLPHYLQKTMSHMPYYYYFGLLRGLLPSPSLYSRALAIVRRESGEGPEGHALLLQ